MIKNAFIFLGTFLVGALAALVVRATVYQPHAGTVPATPAAPVAAIARASAVADAEKPVNTRCAICGMEVDPALPTLEYKGKKIGFGCRMCPPKFKADPDKYGPFYLRNEVIKR